MARYYVNDHAQANGDHEVHVPSCSFFPEADNRTYLGEFSNCHAALRKAKEYYSQVDGCYYCCNDCHTS